MGMMQRALTLVYPHQCVLCAALVESSGALCSTCWRDTTFLEGHVCDHCGAALPGQGDGARDLCDVCMTMLRPWVRGRAALAYKDAGRRIVLALKHGDRSELATPGAKWMAQAGTSVLTPGTLLVPVPSHWTRRIARRYNQAAELSRALARLTELEHCPQALVRVRRTQLQDRKDVAARFQNLERSIVPHPKHHRSLAGANVCLVDDVMTSGATLSVATEACLAAGARQVFVLVLARVEKTP